MKKPTVAQIREALDKLHGAYQAAGKANYEAKTLDEEIWSASLLDARSAAIDALSWVLGECEELNGNLSEECCVASTPYIHEDKETEEDLRRGYGCTKQSLSKYFVLDKSIKEEVK